MKKSLFIFLLTFFGSLGMAFAQRTITGTVTDPDNQPAIGIAVGVEGKPGQSVTDVNGKYSITVAAGDSVLTFTDPTSTLGFKTKRVAVTSSNVLDVQLEIEKLEEVEIIGDPYSGSVLTKEAFVGNATVVGSQDLDNQGGVQTINQMLQGKVPGLLSTSEGDPGSAGQIRINGIGSLGAGAYPLCIIDGVPIDYTSVNTLNPNDIASVTVLKDAAATSIYGSRGANGVIVITTKSGGNQKTKFTFSATQGWTQPYFPKLDDFRMNSDQLVTYQRYLIEKAGYDPDVYDPLAQDYFVPDSFRTKNTDYFKESFRTGTTKTYDFSARGGDKNTQFFASLGYFSQHGIERQTSNERFSTRINVDHRVSDKVTFGVNIGLSRTMIQQRDKGAYLSSPITMAYIMPPFIPVLDENGEYNIPTRGGIIEGYNFVREMDLLLDRSENTRALGNMNLRFDITDDLTFSTMLGGDYSEGYGYYYQPPSSWFSEDDGGQVSNSMGRSLNWNSITTLEYNKTFQNTHNINTVLGLETVANDYLSFGATGRELANDEIKNLSAAAEPYDVTGGGTSSSLVGFFLRTNYAYENKYFLSGTLRRDGSSRFGADNKYATFWSLGASWFGINDKDASLSSLKVRTSVGTSGNQAIGDFESLSLYGFGGIYSGQSASGPANLANPQLTWETSFQANLGIDFGFLKNRITGTIDLYSRRSSNLLFPVPISGTNGFTSITQNFATMSNKGYQVTLTTLNFSNKQTDPSKLISWTTEFNVTRNINKVVELPEGKEQPWGDFYLKEGEPYQNYFLVEYAGVNSATGRPLYYTKDDKLSEKYTTEHKQVVGNAQPKYYGQFTNTFNVKGVTLSFFIYYKFGNNVYNNTRLFNESDGTFFPFNQSPAQMNYWDKPGDITDVPEAYIGNTSNTLEWSRWIEDGSYIRMRQVELLYSLPTSLVNKVKFSNASLAIRCTNLFTITKYKGIDPETSIDAFQTFGYPNARALTIGINASF